GGCFTDWEENIYTGDEFRLEIGLPNGNRLPLKCKALYRFDNTGIGVQFIDITQFEQELIAKLIAHRLDSAGLPLAVDAFRTPAKFIEDDDSPRITDRREQKDRMLEKIMSGE